MGLEWPGTECENSSCLTIGLRLRAVCPSHLTLPPRHAGLAGSSAVEGTVEAAVEAQVPNICLRNALWDVPPYASGRGRFAEG